MHLFRTSTILASLVLLLAGCSTIPGLHMPAAVTINGSDLSCVIESAHAVQTEYTSQISTLSDDIQASTKFNIIDGTALAAASIYHGNRNVLSFFGLAGGTNMAIDATFSPSIQLSTYEAGYSAISCMVDKAITLPNASGATLMSSADLSGFTARLSIPQTLAPKKEGKAEVPAGEPDKDLKIKDALNAEKQRAIALAKAAIAVDTVAVLKANLTSLDHTVRKKLRETLKPQQPTALRDQLIASAVEAQKRKDDAKQSEASIKALNGLVTSQDQDANALALILSPAADIVNFDADLKKCIASFGL